MTKPYWVAEQGHHLGPCGQELWYKSSGPFGFFASGTKRHTNAQQSWVNCMLRGMERNSSVDCVPFAFAELFKQIFKVLGATPSIAY